MTKPHLRGGNSCRKSIESRFRTNVIGVTNLNFEDERNISAEAPPPYLESDCKVTRMTRQPQQIMKITNNDAKKLMVRCSLGAAVLSLCLLTGCVSSHKTQTTQSASVGQQLQDLDKSYKDGIITKSEYDRLRKAIIKQND